MIAGKIFKIRKSFIQNINNMRHIYLNSTRLQYKLGVDILEVLIINDNNQNI